MYVCTYVCIFCMYFLYVCVSLCIKQYIFCYPCEMFACVLCLLQVILIVCSQQLTALVAFFWLISVVCGCIFFNLANLFSGVAVQRNIACAVNRVDD